MPFLPGEGEEEEEFFDDDIPAKATATADDEDEGEDEEEGDDDDEEEYVVEKIIGHGYLDNGTLQLKVKWEGYPTSEATWEPEASMIASADEAVKVYYKKLGGRPEPGDEEGKKKKKRKAEESSTPQTASQRGRKKTKSEDPDDSAGKAKAPAKTIPPVGSWEHAIQAIDSLEEQDNAKGETERIAYVVWNNGVRSKHPLLQLHDKCPKKMLRYYYDHLSISRIPDAADAES